MNVSSGFARVANFESKLKVNSNIFFFFLSFFFARFQADYVSVTRDVVCFVFDADFTRSIKSA